MLLSTRGSYIIEIGLLIPLIMMILIGVIYEALFQYQRAAAGRIAEQAANTGAVLWEREHRNPANNDIYWRLFSNRSVDKESGDQSQKQIFRALEDKVKSDISHFIIKPRDVDIETRYLAGALEPGKVIVTVRIAYKKLYGSWWEKLSGRKTQEMVFNAECSITDPAENIRNVDLAFEAGAIVLKETGAWGKITDKGDGIKDKIQNKINSIKDSIFKRGS